MGSNIIQGFGVNDVDYSVYSSRELPRGADNKRRQELVWHCPYHEKWVNMLGRVYSSYYHKNNPSYIGCSVSEDFKHLTDFKVWVENQPCVDWRDKQLDKDLLFKGNRLYSPETCVFLSRRVNLFLNVGGKPNKYLIGVTDADSKINPFWGSCKDPLKRYSTHLGYYKTEIDAHLAWKAKKHEYALELADLEEDSRVKAALRTRYL